MNVVVADDKINPVYVQMRTKRVHFVRYNTIRLHTIIPVVSVIMSAGVEPAAVLGPQSSARLLL